VRQFLQKVHDEEHPVYQDVEVPKPLQLPEIGLELSVGVLVRIKLRRVDAALARTRSTPTTGNRHLAALALAHRGPVLHRAKMCPERIYDALEGVAQFARAAPCRVSLAAPQKNTYGHRAKNSQ